jgi:hypothetical protein
MTETTMRMSAEDAAAGGNQGFLVLNGAADSPATTIVEGSDGRAIRAKAAEEALRALDGRFSHAALIEHEFPDAGGRGSHKVKVWVPENRQS